MIIDERIKVVSWENDFITSIIWTFVWCDFSNWRSVVIPEVNWLRSVLLIVQRDWERNSLFNNVWLRRMAIHVVWIHEYRLNRFGPKVTSCKLIKIQKVVSPDLNSCVSIFNSIFGIYGCNDWVFVVSKSHRIFEVWEVSWKRNRECYDFICSAWWRVLTLKTGIVLSQSCCLCVI